MKVVLLGGTGQLGRDIIRINGLDFHSIELVTLNRDILDLENVNSIQKILQPLNFDVLVNCTGYHDVDIVEQNARTAFEVNAYAVKELALSCKNKNAWFIHFSTDYVFGGGIVSNIPLKETSKPAPINIYGASKHMGESLARSEYSDATILRVASLFGIGGQSRNDSNFVEAILRLGNKGEEFRVVNDQTISPTSTIDASKALLNMISQGNHVDLLHVVNSGSTTRYEFACEILRQTKLPELARPCKSSEFPTPATRPSFSALDNSRLRSMNFNIPTWQESLEHYLFERERKLDN